MSQSAILKAGYEAVYNSLMKLGAETKLFALSGGASQSSESKTPSTVYFGVSDISQLSLDKNGQTVEADEMIFAAPTQAGCIIFMKVAAETYPPLLETIGLLIQHFKDNNTITLAEHKWHGEKEGVIFLEPVVRDLEPGKEICSDGLPSLTLQYRMEGWINSLNGKSFKRVEKRTITGNIFEQ